MVASPRDNFQLNLSNWGTPLPYPQPSTEIGRIQRPARDTTTDLGRIIKDTGKSMARTRGP
jgi:hypothetical protein